METDLSGSLEEQVGELRSRVRRLEEAGYIQGYHAQTDGQKLGWQIAFFVIVGLESQKQAEDN